MPAVREIAYTFLVIGAIAFVLGLIQTFCADYVARKTTANFRRVWFRALLRQDTAYYDVNNVSGFATTISSNGKKIEYGLGKKAVDGVQNIVTVLAGLAYAFYASWKAALVVLAIAPLIAISSMMVMKLNQSQTLSASKSYTKAGSVAYQTVSSIRTILALNAVPEMVKQYTEATAAVFRSQVKPLVLVGFINGSMLGSFILLYAVLTVFGGFLIYRDVRSTGCDPSESSIENDACPNTGADIFGSMLGVAFAAQGLSMAASFIETVSNAKIACFPAIQAINRYVGSPLGDEREIVLVNEKEGRDKLADDKKNGKVDEEIALVSATTVTTALLPKYEIDSSSPNGLKPEVTGGSIKFEQVSFAYPTRPNDLVFKNFSLDVAENTTVALVGPSGGGKSTTVALLERFYDPKSGSITLDGKNIKDINVNHLRKQFGLVSQEPHLFATSIAANISAGLLSATKEEIVEAARMANAHDFISALPDGYDSQVGDNGGQLSGGQKQRIAIARALIRKPKILLLDEATSALDSESELIVQEALDKLLSGGKRTTIIIAHRLTTIRKADKIAYISDGHVEEIGTHDELMTSEKGLYRSLVEKQYGTENDDATPSSRNSSALDLAGMGHVESQPDLTTNFGIEQQMKFNNVMFSYPTRPSTNVFNGFNLTVRKGETLALVGPSGGGKSTTVGLIERFYDPKSGSIEFGGVDLRKLNVRWLRDQIGFVGQEPVLFDDTVANNIAYGLIGASQKAIENAGTLANAHDFIMSFPNGYDTQVGEGGTQLSGGQKQRIAIARALIKNPKVLILDEATSALDSNSEAIVQTALNDLMSSKDRTTIVIAHRLSTIRDADRIAFVGNGKVLEIGDHDSLMLKPKGRYRRLVESQKRGSTLDLDTLKELMGKNDDENDKAADYEAEIEKEAEEHVDVQRARSLAQEDWHWMVIGGFGAIIAGGVFPAWGVMFAKLVDLLFTQIPFCESDDIPSGFLTCQEYWDDEADTLKSRSWIFAMYWGILVLACLFGNCLLFLGFGRASEGMNKRIRDMAFTSLCRQEVTYFDKRNAGAITSELQDDAAKIQAFSGQPIRMFLTNVSSVITGLIVSFIYMWPFALVSIGTIPFMGFATAIDLKRQFGEDLGDDKKDGETSAGGVAVETLLNVRTVASLNLEESRYDDYSKAIDAEGESSLLTSLSTAATGGLSVLIQQWVNALQFYWGGYLISHYDFTFPDFLISMFSLLFALFALGGSAIGAIDKNEAKQAAGRIFYLINRKSEIDPMSDEGKSV
eukprot:CAMPEP_0198258458 /NCGR_PEP_ID=MMETSP1447-20131203/7876_1 /TAXON_ID=420782 /ORGANISM="Chaetoceros dichaeta, Strain CCMP1751" /LENGTH=1270 /DNA_ID=CAMNT_0043945579 /DNA_START=240 /DNA_END=4052 /DNA_ORIENTATION=-